MTSHSQQSKARAPGTSDGRTLAKLIDRRRHQQTVPLSTLLRALDRAAFLGARDREAEAV
jgi:hypothetical protein